MLKQIDKKDIIICLLILTSIICLVSVFLRIPDEVPTQIERQRIIDSVVDRQMIVLKDSINKIHEEYNSNIDRIRALPDDSLARELSKLRQHYGGGR